MSKKEEEFTIEEIFKDFPNDDDEMFKEGKKCWKRYW